MNTITKATIHRDETFGLGTVKAQFKDGTERVLFTYYLDELAFTERELIGLTASQAGALRHARDVEYLQS